jgi:hypothetical protein
VVLKHDDPQATTEYLKLLLSLYTDANFETLSRLKRIVDVSNRVVATNDNDGPT